MAATLAPQTAWREKAEAAKRLITEIKESASGGVQGAEHQVEIRNKYAEAQRLLAEAKAEREAFESAQAAAGFSEEDLEKLTREAAAYQGADNPIPPAGGGSLGEIISGRTGGHSRDVASFNPFKAGKTQLVKASPGAMGHRLMESVMPQSVRESGRDLARTAMRENASSVIQREIAALIEGTQANGGFLVVPQYLQDLFAKVRRQGNTLRRLGWLNVHQTEETNQVLFPIASGSLTVGLVAELAVKPTADNSYAQVTVSLYTMAGIASISRQLARSADPAIAEILAQDLAALLGNLEEQKVYSGSGSQEPRGIVNTSGTSAMITPVGAGTAQAVGLALLDAMFDMAATIATNYYGPVTGAVMRPSRFAALQQLKDNNNNYILNRPGTYRAPAASEAAGDFTGAVVDLLGFPIAQSTNVPSNLGAGTNQDCVIMGNWDEAHWFQRWDQQLDSSDIATDGAGNSAFATNRVLFRLEEIAGFTAARYPAAFGVVTGAGMVSRY